jgi:tetratricopeptide (TPR) repeat protein
MPTTTKHSDKMSDKKHAMPTESAVEKNEVVDQLTGFWNQYGKKIGASVAIIMVAIAGYYAYQRFLVQPKEKAASEALFKAQDYFEKDSLGVALNGDNSGSNGFLKVISKYSGTKAANLAHYYAGYTFLRQGDFKNAEKHLKEFSTSSPMVSARAKSLLADAYSEQGKDADAARLYVEAGNLVPKDDFFSPQYLTRAAFVYEKMGKTKEAADIIKSIKEKYPTYRGDVDIDKYAGKLGLTE